MQEDTKTTDTPTTATNGDVARIFTRITPLAKSCGSYAKNTLPVVSPC